MQPNPYPFVLLKPNFSSHCKLQQILEVLSNHGIQITSMSESDFNPHKVRLFYPNLCALEYWIQNAEFYLYKNFTILFASNDNHQNTYQKMQSAKLQIRQECRVDLLPVDNVIHCSDDIIEAQFQAKLILKNIASCSVNHLNNIRENNTASLYGKGEFCAITNTFTSIDGVGFSTFKIEDFDESICHRRWDLEEILDLTFVTGDSGAFSDFRNRNILKLSNQGEVGNVYHLIRSYSEKFSNKILRQLSTERENEVVE